MTKTLNRAVIRDQLAIFLTKHANTENVVLASGAEAFARHLQELFPEEKNIHFSKDGEVQNLYHFHFNHGGFPTKKVKWMSPEKAEAYAKKNGYRLELVRTTHKPV